MSSFPDKYEKGKLWRRTPCGCVELKSAGFFVVKLYPHVAPRAGA